MGDLKKGKPYGGLISEGTKIQLSSNGTPPDTMQTTSTEQGTSQESKFTPKTSTASNGYKILFHLHPLSQHALFCGRMWTKWIFGRWQFSC